MEITSIDIIMICLVLYTFITVTLQIHNAIILRKLDRNNMKNIENHQWN